MRVEEALDRLIKADLMKAFDCLISKAGKYISKEFKGGYWHYKYPSTKMRPAHRAVIEDLTKEQKEAGKQPKKSFYYGEFPKEKYKFKKNKGGETHLFLNEDHYLNLFDSRTIKQREKAEKRKKEQAEIDERELEKRDLQEMGLADRAGRRKKLGVSGIPSAAQTAAGSRNSSQWMRRMVREETNRDPSYIPNLTYGGHRDG